MNARAPHEVWVTVAAAAEALTKAGDKITAPNVSRYLARFRDIPQQQSGKYRFVDLAALFKHRNTNVLVDEKRAARETAPAEEPERAPRRPLDEAEDDPEPRSPQNSELNEANVHLKRLRIREAQLDLDEREGRLIPDSEVLALVAGVMETLIAELERQETQIAGSHGRDVAAACRRARKAAQTSASSKLAELARKHLPAHLAAAATGAPTAETPRAA